MSETKEQKAAREAAAAAAATAAAEAAETAAAEAAAAEAAAAEAAAAEAAAADAAAAAAANKNKNGTEVRVLVAFDEYEPDDVAVLDDDALASLKAANQVDDHPSAVAYAKSLKD